MADSGEQWTLYGRGENHYPVAKGQSLPENYPEEVVKVSVYEEALEALRKLLLAADRTETLDDELLAAADEVRGVLSRAEGEDSDG